MIVPPSEVEAILANVRPVTDVARQVGTDDFMESYCVGVERLALQAHLSAAAEARRGRRRANDGVNLNTGAGTVTATAAASNGRASTSTTTEAGAVAPAGALAEMANVGRSVGSAAFGHEYVAEAVLVEGKLEVLVRSLLALECWRTKVLFPPPSEDDGSDALLDPPVLHVLETDEDGALDVGTENAADESNADANANPNANANAQRGLAPLLARNQNSLRAAFILHAETTIVGLLSLLFYRREAFDDDVLSGETAVALVDYVARCLTALAVPMPHNPMVSKQRKQRQHHHQQRSSGSSDALGGGGGGWVRPRSAMEEICDAALDAHYKTSVAALSLAQYLCHHVEELPLAARGRLLDMHDFPLLMIPLIEEPPWTRRREVTRRRDHRLASSSSSSSSDGAGAGTSGTGTGTGTGTCAATATSPSPTMVWEKYVDGDWAEIEPDELLRLTKCEAQPWLVLYHLLCNAPSCREAYGLNTYRKARLSRARKYLVGALTDQLPILADLARYLDELSIMGVPEATESIRGRGGGGLVGGGGGGGGSALLLEQVDTLREDVIRTSLAAFVPPSSDQSERQGWDGVAQEQFATVFSKVTDANDQTLRLISSNVYGEGFESVLGGGGTSDGNKVEGIAGPSLQLSSMPISHIILSVARSATSGGCGDDNRPVECIKLVPMSLKVDGKTSTLVDSPDGTGTFRRTKCKVTLLDGSSASSLAVPSSAGVSAKVFHEAFGHTSTMLELESIDLPATQAAVKTKKEWRQLVSRGGSLVVQLGFKLLSSGEDDGIPPQWTLSQTFVSQPV